MFATLQVMAKVKKKSASTKNTVSTPIVSDQIEQHYTVDLVVVIGMLVLSLVIWWPTRYLPYWWDSAGFIIHAARDLLATNFWPVIARHSDFAHPPLLPVLIALIWKVAGESRLYTHLLMLPFLPLLGIATYGVGRKLLPRQSLAVLTGFLTLLLPVAVAEYGQLYIDLPMAALAMAGMALWLYGRRGLALLVLALAVLMKETAILVLPLLAWWEYSLSESKVVLQQRVSLLLVPVAVLAGWFVYHYQVTGWLLSERTGRIADRLPTSIDQLLEGVIAMQRILFVDQYKWLLFSLAGLAVAYLLYKRKQFWQEKQTKPLWGIAGLWLLTVAYFSVIQEFAPRYGIFLIALLVLLVLWLIYQALEDLLPDRGEIATAVLGGLVAVAFVIGWHPKIPLTATFELAPPFDLSYQDMIMIFRQATTFLEIQHSSAEIYGSFPENQQLTEPFQGYVSKPLEYKPCEEFAYDAEKEQILFIHPYSLGHFACTENAKDYQMELLRRFEGNGKWIELLKVTAPLATPSAEISN